MAAPEIYQSQLMQRAELGRQAGRQAGLAADEPSLLSEAF